MQQAECAHSAAETCASSDNVNETPATTRRGLMGLVAAVGAAAIATPLSAAATLAWDAGDWIERWHRLGCGARLDGHHMLQFTMRPTQEDEAGVLMGELSTPGRVDAVKDVLDRLHSEDGVLRAVRHLKVVEAAFVSEDVDPAANARWSDRADAAHRRLIRTPASTGKGLAAKLRVALELDGTDMGDELMKQILGQLERWS